MVAKCEKILKNVTFGMFLLHQNPYSEFQADIINSRIKVSVIWILCCSRFGQLLCKNYFICLITAMKLCATGFNILIFALKILIAISQVLLTCRYDPYMAIHAISAGYGCMSFHWCPEQRYNIVFVFGDGWFCDDNDDIWRHMRIRRI